MRTLTPIVVAVFLLVAVVPPVHGQTFHAAPASALEAAVQEHLASSAADRETVVRLLARPEVQAIAEDLGIDLRRAERAVTTLDAATLAAIASRAQQAEQALAGGQSTITLSTTMIIIALLLLIVLILALK